MKIGKLRISVTYDKDEMEVAFRRKLSRLDEVRIRQYLAGTHHIHGNPGRRRAENRETDKIVQAVADKMSKPRHTQEELDRLVERVREENSPENKGDYDGNMPKVSIYLDGPK